VGREYFVQRRLSKMNTFDLSLVLRLQAGIKTKFISNNNKFINSSALTLIGAP